MLSSTDSRLDVSERSVIREPVKYPFRSSVFARHELPDILDVTPIFVTGAVMAVPQSVCPQTSNRVTNFGATPD